MKLLARARNNLLSGRFQKTLSALTAVSAVGLGFEIYLEHYKGSFGDKWMWTPIVLTPPLTAAGIAGFVSERAARTWLPAISALYALDGLIGVGLAAHLHLHARDTTLGPAGELLSQALVRVGGEAAASIHGHARVEAAQQVGQRDTEQPRLEVPQRDVHRGHRHRAERLLPEVAHRVLHRGPGRLG